MAYILQRSLHLSTKIKKYSQIKLPNLFRTLTTSKNLYDNYEGDGKTTLTILNKEYKHLIMINSYSNFGFRLNNGIFAIGPLAAFPRTVLQWNVNSVAEITVKSLSLFCLLEPKLDMLIIGTGNNRILPCKEVMQYLMDKKIQPEILPTDQACTLFNFLNTEGRCIAAAFIPPDDIVIYQEERILLETVEAMDDFSTPDYKKIIR